MRSLPPTPAVAEPGRRARRGRITIEATLVLFIGVLAAWIGADVLSRLAHRWRCERYIADQRAFESAWQQYVRRAGTTPSLGPNFAPPPGLAAALEAAGWSRGSPFGGEYQLAPVGLPDGRTAVAIRVTAFSPLAPLRLARADLAYVDSKLDDGNLATGRFRAGFDGWPVYLVAGY